MKPFSFFSPAPLFQLLHTHKRAYCEQITGSSKALLISELQKERPVIIITTKKEEEDWLTDLPFFLEKEPLLFPAWDTFLGEDIAPSPDIIGNRMQALYNLSLLPRPKVIVTELFAMLQEIPNIPTSSFFFWKKGDCVPWSSVSETLEALGYIRSPVVSNKKEYALRNGIIDLFPISSKDPYRIEFFGDRIDTIRMFDPVEQRSIEKKESVFLCPTEETSFLEKGEKTTLWKDLLQQPILVFDDLVALEDLYVSLHKMPRFSSPFIRTIESLFEEISSYEILFLLKEPLEKISPVRKEKEYHFFSMFSLELSAAPFAHAFYPVALELLEEAPELCFYFVYETKSYEKYLLEKIQQWGLKKYTLLPGYLSSGFLHKTYAVFAEQEILQKKKLPKQKKHVSRHASIADFHSLQPGDFVVHFHSGIGKYLGSEIQKNHLGISSEFLLIEYAKQSKLYVPISQAHLISKYIGASEKIPHLTELGSKKWQQAKTKAQKQIIGYASDLLHLYAKRQLEEAPTCKEDSDVMQEFENDFPYTETPDQKIAIEAVKKDLQKKKPMDRLIAGDVGYGKTEVAMRAAFKSVVDGGGQVAVLVPTTVLAMQHYETFLDRMQNYPVKVGVVSRFQSAKENKETVKEVEKGNIDILVGTHRLLSKDVAFSQLTLMIIDEEQRFGVRAKEALKAKKQSVHALSLSATPIPRTLYMSLIGARDISVIATPPQDRLPIKTVLAETDDEVIKLAILRELARQGQVFFIHNRVESIPCRKAHIQKLVPSAKIAIAHGQMSSDQVDQVFHAFRSGTIDVLCATIIVGNGIDVPNANTIIIDSAHCYGVSDLYQIRGRVGRWNRSSYAYFLLPKNRSLKESSQKRLQILAKTNHGIDLAIMDLELRGAGDLLGTKQSGEVASIGFRLYCDLLKRTLESLKNKRPISFAETKMEFSFPAFLPEYYIPEKGLRMEFYHRLGKALTKSSVTEISSELEDRFGKLPKETIFLLHLTNIRLFASKHYFTKLRFLERRLIAERNKGKRSQLKTIPIPKEIHSPEELESYVCKKLEQEFLLEEKSFSKSLPSEKPHLKKI